MNILSLNFVPQNKTTFTAKTPTIKPSKLQSLASDIVEFSQDTPKPKRGRPKLVAPAIMELTPAETIFQEKWRAYNTLWQSVLEQERLLKSYYSAEEKEYKRELVRERSKLNTQLNRLAKKMGMDRCVIEHTIEHKTTYNFYAQKITNCTEPKRLKLISERIEERVTLEEVKKELFRLIKQRKAELKNPQ